MTSASAAAQVSRRTRELHQERPPVPTSPPTRLCRVAAGEMDWGLPRAFQGYDAHADITVGGKATKWVLKHQSCATDFYIAKFGNKNGRIEVYTELFNNQLGQRLGFEMAHSGLARLDSDLYFVTRNFRRETERLIHGSLMVEQVFAAPEETEQISHGDEQSFYTIDVLREVIHAFSGSEDGPVVFGSFVEMLVLDGLLGSMDRHARNWGVLQTTTAPERCRLAPIFDTARALFWDFPEGRLSRYDGNENAIQAYIERSKPCIGPSPGHPNMNNCNHFELIENLLDLYPHQTLDALRKIPGDVGSKAAKLLNQFPFSRVFSGLRKRLITKVLSGRAERLLDILRKGGDNATA